MNNDFDFDQVFELWLRTHRYTGDPETLAQIEVYVRGILEEEGGFLSLSHFERAYRMLCQEGVIQPFDGVAPEPEDNSLTADVVSFIRTAPTDEVRRKYHSDPKFRRQFDEYSGDRPATVSASELTAEAYHRLPAPEVIRRYRSDAIFKSQVDDLIARGLI